MRYKTDLSRRYETFKEFYDKRNEIGCENTTVVLPVEATVKEDGTYFLKCVTTDYRVPDLRTLTREEKYIVCSTSNCERGFRVTYKGPSNIFIGLYKREATRIGRRFFVRTTWIHAIRSEGRRMITSSHNSVTDYSQLVEFILRYFGVECITTHDTLNSKAVLRGIFNQKITNDRDAVKAFLTAVAGRKVTVPYPLAKAYIQNRSGFLVNIADLMEYTTSAEAGMRLLVSEDSATSMDENIKYIFKDLIKDAAALDIKVNPSWSLRRMKDEHTRNNRTLMMRQLDKVDAKPLYADHETAVADGGLKGTVLSSERDVFAEGYEMDHCVYTHYFTSIQKGDYIAMRITTPCRCTVGISISRSNGKERALYNQAYGKRNSMLPEETRRLIREYISTHSEPLAELAHARRAEWLAESGKEEQASETAPQLRPALLYNPNADLPF